MNLKHSLLIALTLISLVGCKAQSSSSSAEQTGLVEANQAWPEALTGPFELQEVLHVFAPMSDGVMLEGWIGLPALPPGIKAPVLMSASPYYGYCPVSALPGCGPPTGCETTPGNPDWWTEEPAPAAVFAHWGMPPLDLIKAGYAVSFFSVRGTGNSGGCFDWYGQRSKQDHAELVEWLAQQPWSNGRVGGGGLSFPALAIEQAAVAAPEALKAIVIAGFGVDLYTFHTTPQGAQRTTMPACLTPISSETSLGGWARRDDPPAGFQGWLDVAPERLCSGLPDTLTQDVENVVREDRDESFYRERRLADDLHKIRAATLFAQGHFDGWRFEDDHMYQALGDTPKRRITGPWPHQFPTESATEFPSSWRENLWPDIVLNWLDYWVKGVGPEPRSGVVDYQDLDGRWHSSEQWPSAQTRQEVLYLHQKQLAARPGEGEMSFVSAPNIFNSPAGANSIGLPYQPHEPLCGVAGQHTGTSLQFVSEPASQSIEIAGLPHLWLRLSSDQPHGLIQARLGKLRSDFSCDPMGQADGYAGVQLHRGGADLRFHAGNFAASPFPVNTPTQVRLDLPDLSMTLQAGERLVLELSYGETHIDFIDRPPYPELTVHAGLDAHASHLVIPMRRGSLGGMPALLEYPERPFAPNSPANGR